jgi:hypothetical protein
MNECQPICANSSGVLAQVEYVLWKPHGLPSVHVNHSRHVDPTVETLWMIQFTHEIID